MAYRVPTLDEMQSFLVALFKSLFPDRNIGSQFSFWWKLIRTITGAVTDIHAHVDAVAKAIMPDTTFGDMLDRWLVIVGSKRKGATPARKSNAARLTGTPGSAFAVGNPLLHRASGLRFQINSTGTIPGAGFVDVDVVGIDTGSRTRLKKGETLECSPTIAGISTSVVLQKSLDEDGTDKELDGAALLRLLQILATPASGGNQADYVRWLLLQPGVSAGFCYPNRAGVGTVDLAALHAGTGSARFLTTGENTTVQAAVALLAPAQIGGTGGSLRMLTVVGETANVEIKVTPTGDTSKAFDWDDATPPTILAYTAATLTVQLAAARPVSMKAGDRVCIFGVASQQDCAPIVINALVGTDSFTLQTTPKKPDGTDATPAATDKVYAGGPLTSIIRDAIVEHINSGILYASDSGPLTASAAIAGNISTSRLKILLEGIGTSNPAGKYGTWTGTLRLDALYTIALYTRGVRSISIVTPLANQDSTDYGVPNDSQIGALSVGYVLIRKG
jgi:uncharacterized phage protein gp47/JayE